MPENELLPKTGKSSDWLAYADKKKEEFKNYHSATDLFGRLKNPGPLQDDYSKLLSDHELQARKMGMDLLRKETARQQQSGGQSQTPSYRKGGRVKKTGPALVHKGEMVRKSPRKKSRGGSR